MGKSLAYLIPAILFAVAQQKKAVVCTHTINLQEQLTEKDLPMLAAGPAGEVQLHDAEGARELPLHAPAAQGDAAGRQPVHLARDRGAASGSTSGRKQTEDGSLSDFEVEPDPKVWAQVCSERGLCSPKLCGSQSDFAKEHGVCFFQRARSRILSADVLVLNHTLFFTLLGGLEEEPEGGVLFKNDFVVFDEAHTVESVASRHIGLSVSSGQIRFALQPALESADRKGAAGHAAPGRGGRAGGELLEAGGGVLRWRSRRHARSCTGQRCGARAGASGRRRQRPERGPGRELRIRRPDLVQDNVTLPIAAAARGGAAS